MGARSSCYDDSVRSDKDTNDKHTMTLLSKDRLFYTFMENMLEAGNICQATSDYVTLSVRDCSKYAGLTKYGHAESVCAYNTSRTDSDKELPYDDCLNYRFLKSLGADGMCRDWTLIYMCSLFGFMKEGLQENATIYDGYTVAQQPRMFSGHDCEKYHLSTWLSPGECVDNSMGVHFEPEQVIGFTNCITNHFMTEMGARSSCSDDFVRHDSDTNVKKTMTLSSTYQYFYTFMEDTLNAGNICHATTDNVTLSVRDCNKYIDLTKYGHAGRVCAYNAPRTDSDRELPYHDCLHYHFMRSLGADSVCGGDRMTLTYICSLFGLVKKWSQEWGNSTESRPTMIYENYTTEQKGRMFSDADCKAYPLLRKLNCL